MTSQQHGDAKRTRSADGTTIAYDVVGSGPPLVIVVGAFNTRSTGAPLAAALADAFTVYTYDRRGRGESTDTAPYAVEREVEDLAAMIDVAGGKAAVLGFSAGAALALKAAASLPVTRLILFGPPIITDDSRPPIADDLIDRIRALVDDGRRGDAVELFQREAVGIPPPVIEKMRHAPFRPGLEAMAHTLVYELQVLDAVAEPDAVLASVTMPTLIIAGGDSPPWLRNTAKALAERLPDARAVELPGIAQDLDAEKVAPVARDFLAI